MRRSWHLVLDRVSTLIALGATICPLKLRAFAKESLLLPSQYTLCCPTHLLVSGLLSSGLKVHTIT
jgi:hypothetical protein